MDSAALPGVVRKDFHLWSLPGSHSSSHQPPAARTGLQQPQKPQRDAAASENVLLLLGGSKGGEGGKEKANWARGRETGRGRKGKMSFHQHLDLQS